MSEHLQPALLLFSCFQTTANNLYLYLCTHLYQSLNPYLYDGRVSIRRRWSSPAFQPEPPGCPSPALLALQTMLMRPWITGITAQDRVILNLHPIRHLCTRGGATMSLRRGVSTLMRLSTRTLIRVEV